MGMCNVYANVCVRVGRCRCRCRCRCCLVSVCAFMRYV